MSFHRVVAELPLITLTLWLQSAGIAALIAWVRSVLAKDIREMGSLRSAALVVRLAMAVVVLHGLRFCCGQLSIVGVACHRGTQRSTSPRVVIPRLAVTT